MEQTWTQGWEKAEHWHAPVTTDTRKNDDAPRDPQGATEDWVQVIIGAENKARKHRNNPPWPMEPPVKLRIALQEH